jgi:hypothetical protein
VTKIINNSAHHTRTFFWYTTLSTEDQTLSIQQKFVASAHHANILWTLDFIAVKYLTHLIVRVVRLSWSFGWSAEGEEGMNQSNGSRINRMNARIMIGSIVNG